MIRFQYRLEQTNPGWIRSGTYINDHHLYIADDEDSIFVGLRDVDVAICHGNGPSPAAVDSLGTANVVLQNARSTQHQQKEKKREGD